MSLTDQQIDEIGNLLGLCRDAHEERELWNCRVLDTFQHQLRNLVEAQGEMADRLGAMEKICGILLEAVGHLDVATRGALDKKWAGIELADGGIIEPPDDDGVIRRRDVHGNVEEVRRIGEDAWLEWANLLEVAAQDFLTEE